MNRKITRKVLEDGLNSKQLQFVENYLNDPRRNAQAACSAAYQNCKPAAVQAATSRLLSNVMVKEYIQERQDNILCGLRKEYEIIENRICEELAMLAFARMTDFVEWPNGNVILKDSTKLDEYVAASVLEVTKTREGLKIKLADKKSALELLGKKLGM